MGRDSTITGVSGYTEQPPVVFQVVKAGEDITEGNVVCWSAVTDEGDADDGISVGVCDAAAVPCGVAMHDADSGDFLRIQTKGLNQVAIVTDNSVAQGDVVYADDAGATAGCTVANVVSTGTPGDVSGRIVGLALAADGGTSMSLGTVILFPIGGYGSGPIPTITGVSGYGDQPDRVIRKLKAGGTIAEGNVVVWDTGDADGMAVIAGSANTIPVGVALEAATDGDYVEVQTRGLSLVGLGAGQGAGNMVYTAASGSVGGRASSSSDGYTPMMVGVSLANSTDAGSVFIRAFGGW